MVSLPHVQVPPWALPLVGGLALGWFFSGTISKAISATHLPIQGGHVAYSYPAAKSGPPNSQGRSVTWPRRSFDRQYDSWLETTVNALPTQG